MVDKIDWIFTGFDACIIHAPKEGIMGLDINGNPIVLNDGDMISFNTLNRDFVSLLYVKGMLTPIKMPDVIKPVTRRYEKLKIKGRSRKNRHKNNHTLDSWMFDRVNGFRR